MKHLYIDYKGWRIHYDATLDPNRRYWAGCLDIRRWKAVPLYGKTQAKIKRKISMHISNYGW